MTEIMIDKMNNLQNEFAIQKQKFFKEMKTAFKEFTVEFFKANPSIKSVIWTQYTPYFNDGDECVFQVHEPYFSNAIGEDINDLSPWGEYSGQNEDVWIFSNWDIPLNKNYKPEFLPDFIEDLEIDNKTIIYFSKLIQSSDMNEIMKDIFGDHCKVIVTEDSIEVESYEHD